MKEADYLYPGSPLVPELEDIENIFGRIKSDILQYGDAHPFFVAATELKRFASIDYGILLLGKASQLYRKFEMTPDDFPTYLLGFIAPLDLISFAYGGIVDSIGSAREMIRETCPEKAYQAYLLRHLESSINLLRSDWTCADVFEYVIRNPFKRDFYYRLGVKASKYIFGALAAKLMLGH